MNFIFHCPKTGQTFETDQFEITENKGVVTDFSGEKKLDAQVRLKNKCPYCGVRHIYHASELACPFG